MFLLVLCSYDFNVFSLILAQDLFYFSFSFRPLSSNYLHSIHFLHVHILDHDYDVDTSKVLGVTPFSSFLITTAF